MTTENSKICLFFFIKNGEFVPLAILTAVFYSIIVEIDWGISRLAASVNFPAGVSLYLLYASLMGGPQML